MKNLQILNILSDLGNLFSQFSKCHSLAKLLSAKTKLWTFDLNSFALSERYVFEASSTF